VVFKKECNLLCRQVKVVGEENKSSLGFFIKILNPTQFLWIILGHIKPSQFTDLVINTSGFIDFPGVPPVKLKVDFTSYHEDGGMQSYPMKPLKVDISSVINLVGAGFIYQIIHHLHIIDGCRGNMNKSRDLSGYIE